jgi:hypothetical protein
MVKDGGYHMNFTQELAQIDNLPPDLQARVLSFAKSPGTHGPAGENGPSLRQFASSLDSVSAKEMSQAIEEECERIESSHCSTGMKLYCPVSIVPLESLFRP